MNYVNNAMTESAEVSVPAEPIGGYEGAGRRAAEYDRIVRTITDHFQYLCTMHSESDLPAGRVSPSELAKRLDPAQFWPLQR